MLYRQVANFMTVLIISDSFLPEGNAAAVHMSELQQHYDEAGYMTMVATSAEGDLDFGRKHLKKIIQVPNKWKRSNKFIRRGISELICALFIGLKLRFCEERKDIERIVVYSPSIFWGITLKIMNADPGKVRLIVRDVFPFWLLCAGILKKSSAQFKILDLFAKIQWKMASRIFLQSEQDVRLLKEEYHVEASKLSLLQTWMNKVTSKTVIRVENLISVKNKNLLWLGNMGIAQNRDFVVEMLKQVVVSDPRVNVNIVGLKEHDRTFLEKAISSLNNSTRLRIQITKQLTHENCVQLALRSDLGIFSLGDQTTPGNVPGKFVTYVMAGLPVFGVCGENTKVNSVVKNYSLGTCFRGQCAHAAASELLCTLYRKHDRALIERYFDTYHSTENATRALNR